MARCKQGHDSADGWHTEHEPWEAERMLPGTQCSELPCDAARPLLVPVERKVRRSALRGASLLSYIMAQGRALMSVQLTSALLWAQ